MRSTSKALILLLILTLPALPGCFKQIGAKASTQIFYDALPTIDAESDVEMAEKSSFGFIKMLEGFYQQNPKDKLTLLLLTRAYSSYAFGFTENEILKNKGKNEAE